jgi:hypothetical protein
MDIQVGSLGCKAQEGKQHDVPASEAKETTAEAERFAIWCTSTVLREDYAIPRAKPP